MREEDKKYILANMGKKTIGQLAKELSIRERKVKNFIKRQKKEKGPFSGLKPKAVFLAVILIGLAVFIIYADSLKGEFLWDDDLLVKDNIYIRSISNAPKLFTRDIGEGALSEFNFYRPLQMLTYMADYSFWRLKPSGYHLTSLILHIFVALAFYFLSFLLFKDTYISLAASILFAVHPLHTEAVSYISGRADLLAALFMLLCLIFYIKSLSLKKSYFYILTSISYALALLSRENALIFPLIVILYHFSFRRKMKASLFTPIMAVWLAYLILRLTLLKALLSEAAVSSTLLQRLPGSFAALGRYLRLLVLPLDLHMEYGSRLFSWVDPAVLLGLGMFILLVVYARQTRRGSLAFFSIGWFFIMLLPHANLYPVDAYMAEHWLYLSSIGFFLIIARLITGLFASRAFKVPALVFLLAIIGLYSILTIRQNSYWASPVDFYEKTLKYAPGSPRLYNNLGKAYKDLDRSEEAIAQYRKAIELKPDYADAYNNLGIAYFFSGKKDEALAAFKKSVDMDPLSAEAYNNLGNTYKAKGLPDQAISSYKKAIELHPGYARAYYNIGFVYALLERKEEALQSFIKAVELDPYYHQAYTNLGNIYKSLGRRKEAVGSYKKALEVKPDHPTAHNNLAVAYYEAGEYDRAIVHCDRAVELGHPVKPQLLKMLKPHR